MTDIAASDFRHPRRYVRLDTLLRLRWLAVLGQLAAIFVVEQGLEFDLPIVPCLTIVGLSSLLNLALQVSFNPMKRLEPRHAAVLLALNIAQLAALLFFTGGLQNPFSYLFLAPVLISATALPTQMTMALGGFAVACATVLGFTHLPLPWDASNPLVLPPIYLIGVWLSIVLAIGVTSLYTFQVTEQARTHPWRQPATGYRPPDFGEFSLRNIERICRKSRKKRICIFAFSLRGRRKMPMSMTAGQFD